MLVVVAIIAILAAMIAPVVLQTKGVARMRCCAENLRQLGTAISRYMDDYDGYGLPPPPAEYRNPWILCPEPLCPAYTAETIKGYKIKRPPNPPAEFPPVYSVSPFTQPKWLWVCPGDLCRGTNWEDKPCWWHFGSSYMYPGPAAYLQSTVTVTNPEMNRQGLYPVKPMIWRNHSRDILLADYYFAYHNGERAQRWTDPDVQSLAPSMSVQLNTVSVLFLDSHMRSVTGDQRLRYQHYTRHEDNPFDSPSKP